MKPGDKRRKLTELPHEPPPPLKREKMGLEAAEGH